MSMTSIREEMWKFRGILFNFAITDLKIRYKNSVLGILWSIVEPLLMLSVLFFVFSTMFKFEIEHFPIYLLSGIVTYNFFRNGTNLALASLSNRSSLITQIYFPRSIPVISSCFTASIMLIIELAILGIFYGSSTIHSTFDNNFIDPNLPAGFCICSRDFLRIVCS